MIGQLPPGWSEVRRDVFGEFMVSVFLAGGNVPVLAAESGCGLGAATPTRSIGTSRATGC